MTTLIGGLYLALGVVMVAQVVLRLKHRDYIRAWLGIVWASLMWRIMIRYVGNRGWNMDPLGPFWPWASNQYAIAVQLALVLIAAAFVLILDWEDGP